MKSASNDTQKRDEKNRKKRFVRKRQMSLNKETAKRSPVKSTLPSKFV